MSSRNSTELLSGQSTRMNFALSELVLIFAVSFNAILSIINGHVVRLAQIHVILAELAVYAGALAVIFFKADRNMWPWFALTLFIVLMGLWISLGTGELNAKYIRDVLVIPVFIMLGMTCRSDSLLRPFYILHTIILLVAVLEIAWPDAYAEVFRIQDYYISTRDYSSGNFYNKESSLFVSATRPGERFFGIVDWHRLSSIFLEPVSLGNYCVIAAIVVIACWREIGIGARFYFIGSTLVLLVGSDGRLAAVSILIIVMAGFFVRNISSRWAVLYLPATLLLSAGYVWALDLKHTADDFSGRLAGSIDSLSHIDFFGLIGLNAGAAVTELDSGITYFILSQSLIGVSAIWLAICLVARGDIFPFRIYVHAIAMFIPLNLMVSYSFFSIKVAALIWFFYGYLYMADLYSSAPESVSSVAHSRESGLQTN
jgi:putative polymerase